MPAARVLLSFALGLFLAITLDKKGLRFQRTYRSLLIIPYAIPGFLSLLVWQGLLNDQFGVVNRIFHLGIPWLFDANWAKVTCILVSAWLTVPYFFLVSMGALQSIPEELTEAARVDGGGPLQIFRRVTLPLLLVAVGRPPRRLLRFQLQQLQQHLLPDERRPAPGQSSIAGSTDILISYTYKLALAAGKGQDYALASAVTIIIFAITALHLDHRASAAPGVLENVAMSTLDAATASAPLVVEAPLPKRKLRFSDTWWRHVVALIACLFALFPVWFVISASINRDESVPARASCRPTTR